MDTRLDWKGRIAADEDYSGGGARPNFMKVAPLLRAMLPHRDVVTPVLVSR